MLVHAGDMVGGSPPISSQFQDEPTIEFLNLLHFDVGTPGNHDLDQGVNEMKRLIFGGFNPKTGYFQGANTQYCSANIIDKNSGNPLLPAYLIKQIDGIKKGFIGVVTMETNLYVSPEDRKEVETTDEVSAINQTVKILKEKGVNAIVVLAHESASSDLNGARPNGELIEMAAKIDNGVDVIFAGHSHEYANTVAAGKLIVQAYSSSVAFSMVNLEIDPQTKVIVKKQAKIIVTSHDKAEPDKTYSLDPDAPLGKRITALKDMNGYELLPSKEYEVAVSSYLASGGDNFTAFQQGKLVETGPLVVDALISRIKHIYP
jgi:5'-nucleotidase